MIICGLKLTHDGSVALIEDGKLIFSVEIEKLNNNPRFTEILDTNDIDPILKDFGYKLSDIDYFSIDGWGGRTQERLAIQPRLEIGNGHNKLSAKNHEEDYQLNIGLYEEDHLDDDVLKEWNFEGLKINENEFNYSSYLHVAGHIMSAYCTSEFSKRNESSYVLVWDGGMYPRLYFFDAEKRSIENLGPIFLLIGNMYTIFSQHFGPFNTKSGFAKDSLSIAGKVMAYIALGNPRRELLKYFDNIYLDSYKFPMGFANVFANEFKEKIATMDYSDEDILSTFHVYLEEMLVSKLNKKIRRHGNKVQNLCIAGGCGLNIKWNSAIRNSELLKQVYVPPFPNDSGSAIGVACCTMVKKTGNKALDWNVYSGPTIIKNEPAAGWNIKDSSLEELAILLHEKEEPVVLLNGQAELGPRALGNRSIIAPVTSKKMKEILNMVKKREAYRPVSPICLEEYANEYFEPGTKDPYMLFDHMVKKYKLEEIPAVVHLDGSARLQTISSEENRLVAELLKRYEVISGIPMLCNTSANFNGTGFFPDVHSATKWGMVNYVWCDNTLYEKEDKITF